MARPVWKIHATSAFQKSFRKPPRHIQDLSIKKDQWFRKDAYDPRLRTHSLKGELQGYYSYSVNNAYRVLFRFVHVDEVVYYDIGTHGIYKAT